MYKISDDLAKELLKKIKSPEIISKGEKAFTFKDNENSIGIADVTCAIGTDFPYLLECPVPVIYKELPHIPASIMGYFLYKKEELFPVMESWEVTKALFDLNIKDYEEKIDVSDCSILLASDVDKLVAPTINSMEQLIKKEPKILDCLNLG